MGGKKNVCMGRNIESKKGKKVFTSPFLMSSESRGQLIPRKKED
jgi:hypothetical protein